MGVKEKIMDITTIIIGLLIVLLIGYTAFFASHECIAAPPVFYDWSIPYEDWQGFTVYAFFLIYFICDFL